MGGGAYWNKRGKHSQRYNQRDRQKNEVIYKLPCQPVFFTNHKEPLKQIQLKPKTKLKISLYNKFNQSFH